MQLAFDAVDVAHAVVLAQTNAGARNSKSEWDFVVAGRSGFRGQGFDGDFAGFGGVARAHFPVKQLDVLRFDFGDVPFGSIPIIVTSSSDSSFNIKERSFLDVLLAEFSELSPGHDAVPIGAFLFLAAL
jgi:hypothetical protein